MVGIFFAMTKHEIVDKIIKDESYLNYCKRVCGERDEYKDLFQYTILSLLEKKEEEIEDVYKRGSIKPYVARIIWFNANNPTSQFNREHRSKELIDIGVFVDRGDIEEDFFKTPESLIESNERDEFAEWANKFDEGINKECERCIKEGVYPAPIKIYQIYEEIGNMREVSKCTQIPYDTIKRYVSQTRKKILNRLNEDTDSNPT